MENSYAPIFTLTNSGHLHEIFRKFDRALSNFGLVNEGTRLVLGLEASLCSTKDMRGFVLLLYNSSNRIFFKLRKNQFMY